MTYTAKDLQNPANCLCFNLRRSARLATRRYDEALFPAGITSTQFSALAVLAAHGSLTMTQFADAMETERTTSTRNLKILESEKLVTRRAGKDKRIRLISISAKGRRAFERALPLWRVAQKRLVTSLGESTAGNVLHNTGVMEAALT